MPKELRQLVCQANKELMASGLVFRTFGNVSGVDRDAGVMVIKPSGVPYDELTARNMVVVELESGRVVDSELRPSSDTPVHLGLYRAFGVIGGIAHTHSVHATAWAQARRDIIPMGTTHADYFSGSIPCTREMTADEVNGDYEANIAKVIVERFAGISPEDIPAVLVANHGPFAWGPGPAASVANAVMLEHVALLAGETIRLEPYPKGDSAELLSRHFSRKHGPGAYYGQK